MKNVQFLLQGNNAVILCGRKVMFDVILPRKVARPCARESYPIHRDASRALGDAAADAVCVPTPRGRKARRTTRARSIRTDQAARQKRAEEDAWQTSRLVPTLTCRTWSRASGEFPKFEEQRCQPRQLSVSSVGLSEMLTLSGNAST